MDFDGEDVVPRHEAGLADRDRLQRGRLMRTAGLRREADRARWHVEAPRLDSIEVEDRAVVDRMGELEIGDIDVRRKIETCPEVERDLPVGDGERGADRLRRIEAQIESEQSRAAEPARIIERSRRPSRAEISAGFFEAPDVREWNEIHREWRGRRGRTGVRRTRSGNRKRLLREGAVAATAGRNTDLLRAVDDVIDDAAACGGERDFALLDGKPEVRVVSRTALAIRSEHAESAAADKAERGDLAEARNTIWSVGEVQSPKRDRQLVRIVELDEIVRCRRNASGEPFVDLQGR